eukprot:1683463-Lingulodinium_polyedra.AAC.1
MADSGNRPNIQKRDETPRGRSQPNIRTRTTTPRIIVFRRLVVPTGVLRPVVGSATEAWAPCSSRLVTGKPIRL